METEQAWRGIRQAATPWLITAAVIGLLLLMVAVTGGFTPASDTGRRVEAGRSVEVGEWRLVVHSAELTDVSPDGSYDTADTVRVHLDVTHRGEATVRFVPHGLIRVVVDSAPVEEELQWRSADPDREYAFDPDVTESVLAELAYADDQHPPAPATVRVVIHDVRWDAGLLSEDWQVGAAVAHVDLPLADRRTGG
ncbi:hypothetical protein [Microlunatus sp. Y2014]|uniref:hypothetical protein n=1 Tax=Microlunatus sp. Y2014 TaxID=3418488 RepID=UPI003DA78469